MQTHRVLLALGTVLAVVASACSSGTVDTTTTIDPATQRDTTASRSLPDSTMLGTNVAGVSLPDVSNGGAPFEMIAPDGGVLVMYFGFTACPDVCPTTMADLRAALTELGDAADRVEVAMATVDPDRDSDEVITDYVQFFVPNAHALRTTDADELKAAADAFGVSYSVTTLADGTVDVGHSPFLYAVDAGGAIRATWAFGAEPGLIADDIAALLDG